MVGADLQEAVEADRPITPMARRIHGITNEMAAAAPDFAELAAPVRTRLDGAVLVAHNAGVDLAMLRRKLPGFTPMLVLDTLKLSRQLRDGQQAASDASLATCLSPSTSRVEM
jgi:exodeoxyribonuclease X